MNSESPYLQAFYSLGLENTNKLLSKYFPHFKDDFEDVINQLRTFTKSNRLDVKTMNSIYNDLFAYILNSKQFFGGGNIGTSAIDADEMINKFPKEFEDLKKFILSKESNKFLENLRVVKDKKIGADIIVFRNLAENLEVKNMRINPERKRVMGNLRVMFDGEIEKRLNGYAENI